ncbi:MAG: multifunctional oxoglutarate decarboxylase/oxoglutarate dehydrogenase thiamine pyrophosphate-binding subunit/dihydrolipoyllysine-residue succinyltransferase subunit [Egibacteraceae bacterium]
MADQRTEPQQSGASPRIPSQQFGANAWVVEEMYRDYLEDPNSVGGSWREFFSDYSPSWGPAPQAPTASSNTASTAAPKEGRRLRGTQSAIAANMNTSLGVPTATSIRVVPAKLLEVNRLIINNQLARTRGGKVSFTHLIGWAVVRAMGRNPALRSSYVEVDGTAYVRTPAHLNLGLAIDVERAEGRTLLVPNIKQVDTLDFVGFVRAYEDVIRRIREHKLTAEMFADTTATITNPGTVGTVGSVPRLMAGQSVIVGVGAIDYPAEYQGADPRRLADIAVGKVMTITSTYDHRVIQGAESGLFLKTIHELLLGEHGFYDEIFTSLRMPYVPVRWHRDENSGLWGDGEDRLAKQVAVMRLLNAYRVRGHLIANLNPLAHTYQPIHAELDPHTYGLTIWDLDREFLTGGLASRERMTLGAILSVLRDAYCRTVGVEYMHIQEPEQKRWIQDHVEGASTQLKPDEQRHILAKLNAAEAFERFLHSKYIGHKRFSLEGAESVIPMLDALLTHAASHEITDVVMGMAHRGRLNVLANIVGKKPKDIFRQFEGDIDPDSVLGSGDVKYHLGASGVHHAPDGTEINLKLTSNPSHLEAVDPVVVGMARAKLDQMAVEDQQRGAVLPIIVHGDAAFAGQGVAAETLALSQLRGYWTHGTVHLVINNQIGFTTAPYQYRSSQYTSDVAKMVQAPIFHVNGDDPEAGVRVIRLALDFRQRFAKDVVVDMICYRRWGHNETDEPSYTQPIMYKAIEGRRSVRKLYTAELVNRGDLSVNEAEEALSDFRDQLERALRQTRESAPPTPPRARKREVVGVLPHIETGVDRATLDRVLAAVTSWPDGFVVHPKLGAALERRRDLLARDAVDWAAGELLAFGSLLLEGVPVRLAGEDSRRGTFSQRHAVLVHYESEDEYVPLGNLDPAQAPFMIYDSPLSEFAAMGFEYGYSVARKDALVCWEAQFGDFANGGQVIIDEFVVAAEDKWGETSGLVLLLPHGYEGQGPDHSSARLERFLTLAAEDNIQVAQPTTAAQCFHLLRRQVRRDARKPLVVLTPKALLRSRAASSPTAAFTSGSFQEVLGDPGAPDVVRRVLLCSGKIAYDLMRRRDGDGAAVAVVRVEQLYPWPQRQVRAQLDRYPGAQVVWVQDEPANQGAWAFARPRLRSALAEPARALWHVARGESGSPATGSQVIHAQEHAQLLDEAFAEV